jgi:hypothetical protein
MAKKPDTPCAGGCGKLLWTGSGSKPSGERKCRDCRAAQPKTRWESKAKNPGRTGRPWRQLREQVLAEEDDCFRCGEPVDKTLPPRTRWSASVDHKVALTDGGAPLDRANLALAHHGCNGSAGQAQRNPGKTPQFGKALASDASARFCARGKRLWKEMRGDTLDPMRKLLLEEACRLADRLDRMDASLNGESAEWLHVQTDDGGEVTVVVDRALSEARQHATALKQIVAELRQSAAGGKPATGGGVLDQLAAKRAQRRAGAAG